MARLFSNRDRPFDLGELPTELLPRAAVAPVAGARQPANTTDAGPDALLGVLPEYRALVDQHLDGAVARARAPVPDDFVTRARNLKASAYFLDAKPAGYVRALGWSARGQVAGNTQVDLSALAQGAGVAKAVDRVLCMPYSTRGFRLAVVTTDYPMATELPSHHWPRCPGPTRPPSWAQAARGRGLKTRSGPIDRCIWSDTRWSASAGWMHRPPWCCAMKSAACPSGPTTSRVRWRPA